MKLADQQNRALEDIVHHSMSRAADVISQLTGSGIALEATRVTLCEAPEAKAQINIMSDKIVSVTQLFVGDLSGSALLILDEKDGTTLARQLIADDPEITDIDAERADAISEVGNILLNCLVGSLSNNLGGRVDYTVPAYQERSLSQLLSWCDQGGWALLSTAEFVGYDNRLTGIVLILLPSEKLEKLLDALESKTGPAMSTEQ